jgi:hypothetical protein
MGFGIAADSDRCPRLGVELSIDTIEVEIFWAGLTPHIVPMNTMSTPR